MKIRRLKVFLCYAHADRKVVHAIYSALRKAGIDVWIDRENLLPGQDWPGEIRRAIMQSNVIIVFLSRRFNRQKGFRHEELKMALEKARSMADDAGVIIPARLERCAMPAALRHLQRVDLFEYGQRKKLIQRIKRSHSAAE